MTKKKRVTVSLDDEAYECLVKATEHYKKTKSHIVSVSIFHFCFEHDIFVGKFEISK